jgi:uncharacterized protein
VKEPGGSVEAGERMQVLDVLRGAALFGVFLANFVGFAGVGVMATEQQLLSLPSGPLDYAVGELVHWLINDKANTLFAFLFGLGFYLQMQRLGARGVDFDRIYLRRLWVLFAMGVIHTLFFWLWDILNLYALAGFALFALRRLDDRRLLGWGIVLALFGRTADRMFLGVVGADWHGYTSPFSDAAVLARQAASQAGDYWRLFSLFMEFTLVDWLLSGLIVGWFLYALGRFMIGAWVGRQRWLQRAGELLPQYRRVMRVALPLGLIGEGIAVILGHALEFDRLPSDGVVRALAFVLHLLSVPLLAAGYLAGLVVGLHTPLGRRILMPFAAAGRMALSNYVAQSFIYAFVLFGVGPGLALAGRIGATAVVGIVVVGYGAQIALSVWWLGRYRYGPLEWLWRGLTYGEWPRFRSVAA